MDEGINTYATARVLDEAFPTIAGSCATSAASCPWTFPRRAVLAPRQRPDRRLSRQRRSGRAGHADVPLLADARRATMSYNKTALWLHTLERHLGWPTMQRILATYFERWKFRHPRPADFFQIVERGQRSGPDLVLRPGLSQLEHLRLRRAGSAERAPRRAARIAPSVIVRRYGEATFPVDVVTTFADGHQITETLERERSPRDLRLRARVARGERAGRSAPRAAARRRLHEQQPDARAAQPRRQPEVGARRGWSGCRT